MTTQQIIDDRRLVAKLMSGRTGQMKSYVAILLVSVGKDIFEGDALKAAVQMINQEFKGCCIVVADTLQRYNIATEKQISAQQAYDESLANGDAWLNKYEPYFANTFKIPYEILRWDSLIKNPDFFEKQNKFSSFTQNHPALKQAMDQSIEEYGERLQKRFCKEAFAQIFLQHQKNCFSYLQEECIAITFLPQQSKINDEGSPLTIVYPGKSTAILTANWELFIQNEFSKELEQYNDFLNWLPYRFNKVKTHDGADLIQSLKLKEYNGNKKEEISFSKKVDYVNKLSEAQLYSMHNLLDDKSIYEFNSYVLGFLLNQNNLFCEPVEGSLGNEPLFSIELLAYVFFSQMVALLNTLDKKIANQCKANIVRILKRVNLNLSSVFKEQFLVS